MICVRWKKFVIINQKTKHLTRLKSPFLCSKTQYRSCSYLWRILTKIDLIPNGWKYRVAFFEKVVKQAKKNYWKTTRWKMRCESNTEHEVSSELCPFERFFSAIHRFFFRKFSIVSLHTNFHMIGTPLVFRLSNFGWVYLNVFCSSMSGICPR